MSIKHAFNEGAKDYDAARRQLIPCFDDFYGTAVERVPFAKTDQFTVLDLGAGTGLLSSLVQAQFPGAVFTLVDISELMLEQAKQRFANHTSQVNYLVADYAKAPIENRFDLVISSLSIHHLSGPDKAALFGRIYHCLNEGGMFINADQVLGSTPAIESDYRAAWLRQVKEKGVSDTALSQALERMKEDKMSTLSDQLSWLGEAGFERVNCWYQNYSFVVFSGQKPIPPLAS